MCPKPSTLIKSRMRAGVLRISSEGGVHRHTLMGLAHKQSQTTHKKGIDESPRKPLMPELCFRHLEWRHHCWSIAVSS